MNKMVNIKKTNGELINAELITYFQVASLNKQYIFYTSNEAVENGLIKMYVASVVLAGQTFNITGTISDEEWIQLKNIMKKILTGNADTDIKYLNIGG